MRTAIDHVINDVSLIEPLKTLRYHDVTIHKVQLQNYHKSWRMMYKTRIGRCPKTLSISRILNCISYN